MSLVFCANCGWKGDESRLTHTVADGNVPNLHERVDPEEEMPVGECLDCGSLVHYLENPGSDSPKKTILLVMDVERMYRHGGQVRVPVEVNVDAQGKPIITSSEREEAEEAAFNLIDDAELKIFDCDSSSDYTAWSGSWEDQ